MCRRRGEVGWSWASEEAEGWVGVGKGNGWRTEGDK